LGAGFKKHNLRLRNGALRTVKKIGNAQLFEPAIVQSEFRGGLVRDLLDLFGGSPRLLMHEQITHAKHAGYDTNRLLDSVKGRYGNIKIVGNSISRYILYLYVFAAFNVLQDAHR
jgi:hypothetical protein